MGLLEKFADKATKVLSKKTIENTKQAIVEDVKKNQTGYIMAGITGLVLATGVVMVVKMMIGAPPTPPVYSITNNYYLNITPEQAEKLIENLPRS